MTINTNVRRTSIFTGNGTADTFPFTFKVFNDEDIEVVVLDNSTTSESVYQLGTDYTVALNDAQDFNAGGNITLVSGALPLGYSLVITSNIENLQPVQITNLGGFFPAVINDALDRATIQIQQLQEAVDRSAKLPITNPADAEKLVSAIVAASLVLIEIETIASNMQAVIGVNANMPAVIASLQNSIDAAQSASEAASSELLAAQLASQADASSTSAVQAAAAAAASELLAAQLASQAAASDTSAIQAATAAAASEVIATTQAGVSTTQAAVSTTQADKAVVEADKATASATAAEVSAVAANAAANVVENWDVKDDTSPLLGGALDAGGFHIFDSVNSTVTINGVHVAGGLETTAGLVVGAGCSVTGGGTYGGAVSMPELAVGTVNATGIDSASGTINALNAVTVDTGSLVVTGDTDLINLSLPNSPRITQVTSDPDLTTASAFKVPTEAAVVAYVANNGGGGGGGGTGLNLKREFAGSLSYWNIGTSGACTPVDGNIPSTEAHILSTLTITPELGAAYLHLTAYLPRVEILGGNIAYMGFTMDGNPDWINYTEFDAGRTDVDVKVFSMQTEYLLILTDNSALTLHWVVGQLGGTYNGSISKSIKLGGVGSSNRGRWLVDHMKL